MAHGGHLSIFAPSFQLYSVREHLQLQHIGSRLGRSARNVSIRLRTMRSVVVRHMLMANRNDHRELAFWRRDARFGTSGPEPSETRGDGSMEVPEAPASKRIKYADVRRCLSR